MFLKNYFTKIYDEHFVKVYDDRYEINLWVGAGCESIPAESGLDLDTYSHITLSLFMKDGFGNFQICLEDYQYMPELGLNMKMFKYNDGCFETIPREKLCDIVEHLNKRFILNQVANRVHSNICEKCGMPDEYAAPSAKHNNQVRCYRCC